MRDPARVCVHVREITVDAERRRRRQATVTTTSSLRGLSAYDVSPLYPCAVRPTFFTGRPGPVDGESVSTYANVRNSVCVAFFGVALRGPRPPLPSPPSPSSPRATSACTHARSHALNLVFFRLQGTSPAMFDRHLSLSPLFIRLCVSVLIPPCSPFILPYNILYLSFTRSVQFPPRSIARITLPLSLFPTVAGCVRASACITGTIAKFRRRAAMLTTKDGGGRQPLLSSATDPSPLPSPPSSLTRSLACCPFLRNNPFVRAPGAGATKATL